MRNTSFCCQVVVIVVVDVVLANGDVGNFIFSRSIFLFGFDVDFF